MNRGINANLDVTSGYSQQRGVLFGPSGRFCTKPGLSFWSSRMNFTGAVLVSSVLRALWHWLWPCGQSLARCCLLARCPQHADQLLVLCGGYFRSIRPFTCYMCHVTSYSFFHANDDNNSRPLNPEYSKPGLDTCSFLLRMTGKVLLTV